MPRKNKNLYKRIGKIWEQPNLKNHLHKKDKYEYALAKDYKETMERLVDICTANTQTTQENIASSSALRSEKFDVIANEWFAAQKSQWKQSSIVKYSNILNSYLLPDFSEREISEITRDEIVAFGSKLLENGGASGNGLSPKTVTGIISVLKNVFQYATHIKGYAVADIQGISVKHSQKPMRILSRAEQQALSKYLYAELNPCNLGILICLYTGLRIGEICALKWKDISFEEQYLYVHQTMQRLQMKESEGTKTAVIISTPKSDCSIRRVPIPNDIFLVLKEAKQQENAFILTGTAHSYMEPRTMQNRFKKVIQHCNIADANFHALRHTFATRCVELGFDMKSLSEILGHASVNITLNRYVHPSMELKQKNMNMLSELFRVK